jgi:nicotinamidase/pyrazinamidase
LIIVGLQNDFHKTVPGADNVIETINTLRSSLIWDAVVRAEIAHPENHVSFLSTSLKQGEDVKRGDVRTLEENTYELMPSYCVSGTAGAATPEKFVTSDSDYVIQVGTDAAVPVCSAFRNLQATVVGDNMTALGKVLKGQNVTDVYIVGLGMEKMATQTAMDALHFNFASHVIIDACKGWSEAAVTSSRHSLEARGVELLQSEVLLQDNLDRRADAVAYIESNNIPVLFQQLTAELVYHKPDNPREFLIRELQKRQKQPLAEIPRVSLLTDDDLGTMFDMLDPIGIGKLSGKQVMQGLKGLGMRPAEQVDLEATFDVQQFKRVVLSAF